MQKSVSVLANETYEIFRDIEIQTDYLIPVRKPNLEKKRSCYFVDFTVPADHNKNKRKRKYRLIS